MPLIASDCLPHQVVETTWALFELNGSLQGDLTERLLSEIDRRTRTEPTESLCDALRLLGSLPMRRPWPLLAPLGEQLCHVGASGGVLVPQMLTEVIDGLARLRYVSMSSLIASDCL